MRNYQTELENRIAFIQNQLRQSGADGIVLGLSGGKDSALVGILCKKACDNTVGLILPCMSKRNYEMDREDACSVASQYSISLRTVDLSAVKSLLLETISASGVNLSDMASANISPRLRMLTLYAVAASENRLVAGTGNRSEAYMGYFTKWGDGAHDFNPIADLTVTEIYEFLDYLGAPRCVMEKAPSAALFEGQTDEGEMGITYARIDRYLLTGEATAEDKELIERFHARSLHKTRMPLAYPGG